MYRERERDLSLSLYIYTYIGPRGSARRGAASRGAAPQAGARADAEARPAAGLRGAGDAPEVSDGGPDLRRMTHWAGGRVNSVRESIEVRESTRVV